MSDPTLDLLERFTRPEMWEHIDYAIPIMKPHVAQEVNPIDKKPFQSVYDVARLERMVERLLKLGRESAVFPRMTLGHTILELVRTNQQAQPDTVGYLWNPRIGTFGPARTPAILMDRYFLPGMWEESKKYPYRSPEFISAKVAELVPGMVSPDHYDAITAVALLKTDPKLDLGLTLYGECPWLRFYSESFQMDPTQTPADPVAPVPDPALYEQFKSMFMRCFAECYPALAKEHHAESALAAPSATNTAEHKPEHKPEHTHMQRTTPETAPVVTPAPAPVVPAVVPAPADEDTRLRLNRMETLLSQYQRENESLKATVTQLHGNVQVSQDATLMAQYERDLNHLLSLGIQVNVPEELADCKDESGRPITQAAFKKLYHRIETKYPKGPVNAALGSVGGARIIPNQALGIAPDTEMVEQYQAFHPEAAPEVAALNGQVQEDDVMPIIQYQESHPGMTWNQAVEAVMKAKKKTA
jgi:hypothetical protein